MDPASAPMTVPEEVYARLELLQDKLAEADAAEGGQAG